MAAQARRTGRLLLAAALVLATPTYAQVKPDIQTGTSDGGQSRHDRLPADQSPIEKEKPEIEVFTGPDLGAVPPSGIVILPDEAGKTSPAPARPPKEEPAPSKKPDNY